MADRSVVIKLGLNASGLVAGARTAEKSLQGVGARGLDWVGKNEQSINTLATGVGALGLAAVGAAGLAVRSFANFDQAMSFVAATGDDARGSIDELRQAAIDAGAATAFSATEAADGIEQLAKAGVSAKDILAGGLTGALDLAAAGGISVGEAAETAATAMTQFDLAGEDVVHVADLLAAGAGKAQGGVTELGQALKQSGLVASQTGLTIEETTGALSAFAAAGLLGSDAGTSFKTMLQRLSAPLGPAKELMEELNLSAYDAQGNFVGLANFAGQLQGALEDMTPAQRNAALATIFGSDAVRAAAVLYEEGEAGARKWIAAVNDQGYAAETAATRMDNLKGDWEEFTGSMETALIGIGEGADGPLRKLVQRATGAVNAFNDLPDGAKNATLAIVGGGGLVALGVAGLGKLLIAINNTRGALSALGLSMRRLTLAGGGIGLALGAAGFVLNAFLDKKAEGRRIVEEFTAAIEADSGALGSNTQEVISNQIANQGLADLAEKAGVSIDTMARAIAGDERALAELNARMEEAREAQRGVADTGHLAAEGYGEQTSKIDDQTAALFELVPKVEEQASAVEKARGEYELSKQVTDQVNSSLGANAEASDDAAAAASGLTGEIQTQAESLSELVDQLQAAGLLALSTRDAQRNLQDSIDQATESLDENGRTLDITTEKGRSNQSALDDIASSTYDLIEAMASQNATGEQMQAVLSDSRTQFIKTATQMGLTKKEARALADQLGLIPGNYEAIINADDQASGTIDAVKDELDGLDGRTVTSVITTIRQDWFRGSGVPGGLASGTDNWRGGLTWVGEEGPELVNLPRGSQVFPADESRRMASTATLVPLSPAAATVTERDPGPAEFVGDLYLDSGEFLGKVRGEVRSEISNSNRQTGRRARAGQGRAR